MKSKYGMSTVVTLVEFAKMTGGDEKLFAFVANTAREVMGEATIAGPRLSCKMVALLTKTVGEGVEVAVNADEHGITKLWIHAGEADIEVMAAA